MRKRKLIFFPSRINIPFRRISRRKVFFVRGPHLPDSGPGHDRLPGLGARLHRLFLWVQLPKKPAAKKESSAPELPGSPPGPRLAARGARQARLRSGESGMPTLSLTTLGKGSRNRCDSGKDLPGHRPGSPEVRCGNICPRPGARPSAGKYSLASPCLRAVAPIGWVSLAVPSVSAA